MRGNTITITMPLKRGKVAKTDKLFQYDYGQKLLLTDVELPAYYEVHFSNEMHGEAVTSIGDETGVLIPDSLLETGESIYLWLFLHDDLEDGETEFQGVIPVIRRAKVTDQTPTPHEQTVIEQAIIALNEGIETAVEQATAAAAEVAAEAARVWAEGTDDPESPAYQNSAKEHAEAAAESAQEAAGAAQTAAETAAATAAQAAAEQAVQEAAAGVTAIAEEVAANVVIVSDTEPTEEENKLWIEEDAEETYIIPTSEDMALKINEPASEGTSGQVLTTDGNGGRSWQTVQGGGGGGGVSDVQVNGASVVSDGVASISLPTTQTISGTTPSITGVADTRYVCGEVASLSVTAPASGVIDVLFSSGSTPTVLSVSSAKTGVTAIKWANGFDPTSLEANTTYEINILDGEFGVVGSWT